MLVPFKWYLHGGKPYEYKESFQDRLGEHYSDELLDKMGYPFYEVELECTVDTDTGEVKIISYDRSYDVSYLQDTSDVGSEQRS